MDVKDKIVALLEEYKCDVHGELNPYRVADEIITEVLFSIAYLPESNEPVK